MAGTLLQMSIARVLLGLAESRLDLQKTESGWISGPRFAGQVGRVMSQLDYQPFIHACANDRLDVAKWLWSVCPVEGRQAMLSANNYVSFRFACEGVCLDVVEWLWSVCPDEDKQEMLSSVNTDRLRAQVCELLATFRKDLDDRVDECNTAVVPTSFGRRG